MTSILIVVSCALLLQTVPVCSILSIVPARCVLCEHKNRLDPLHLPETSLHVSADLQKGETEIEWKLVKAAQKHFVLFLRPPRIKNNKTNFTTNKG